MPLHKEKHKALPLSVDLSICRSVHWVAKSFSALNSNIQIIETNAPENVKKLETEAP